MMRMVATIALLTAVVLGGVHDGGVDFDRTAPVQSTVQVHSDGTSKYD